MNVSEVKDLCHELGIRPSKRLGQNFLIDSQTCQKIVDECRNSSIKNIIEIGPGLGALTRGLSSLDKNLRLIEFDKKLANYWETEGFDVIHQDALKYPWEKELVGETLVISNLPYQISSSIVIELGSLKLVKKMVFMFQKEVAQRIKAKEGGKDYGLLSIIGQTYWHIDKLLDVPARAFFPPPKIESRVLIFERKEGISYPEPEFTRFVKMAFSHRRKLLSKNLKAYSEKGRPLKEAFAKLNLNEKVRAEELSVETLQQLFLELNYGN